jgi:nucleoside-diphosphate-sugar epimerase
MGTDRSGRALERIEDVAHLEDLLSDPTERAVETMASLEGDLLVLGIGGKMGPTLARMARRADEAAGVKRRIIGVSRFSTPGQREELKACDIETIACDLLEPGSLEGLPEKPNVVLMTGMKFGSTGNEARTWAMNTFLPGMVAQRFGKSRMVAFSTGNVYGMTPVGLGGSLETDPLRPQGEYAQSALGRERILEHFSRTNGTPMALLRLNYATEMRYGVLVDVARRVQANEPVGLAMGHFNALWQGDANAMTLCAFGHLDSPPRVINLAGPELLSVRRVAEDFGRRLGRMPVFEGEESGDALLSNGQWGHRLFGYPRIGPSQMIAWIADWVARGGASLDKPTHFEVRDGNF